MGIRIQQLSGSGSGKTAAFETGPVTLGRRKGHHIEFDPERDRAVSGDHAEIVRQGGRWLFCDVGSSNGSWIGENRITELEIRGGEEISIGRGGPLLRLELTGADASPAPAAVAPSAAGGKAVGSKTVGMMIDAALAQSRHAGTGKVATTAFIRSVAAEAARHGSRRFKIAMLLVVAVLVAAIALLVVELQRTRVELRDVAQAKSGPAEIGEAIAQANRGAIYLLLYQTRTGFEQGFCTGFAVAESRLLTNAHCVAQIEKLAREGAAFFAAPNEGLGARYKVTAWKAHAGYDPASAHPTADLGAVTLDGRLPSVVPFADTAALQGLQSGAQIFVFGFPGDLSDVRSPVATLTEGVIGRLTALDGQAAAPEGRQLIQHSAFTSKGTSGSPVFDKSGRVVAINSGYYQGKSRVMIEDPTTGKSEQANVSRDLSGYSFGIRIDLAAEVLR